VCIHGPVVKIKSIIYVVKPWQRDARVVRSERETRRANRRSTEALREIRKTQSRVNGKHKRKSHRYSLEMCQGLPLSSSGVILEFFAPPAGFSIIDHVFCLCPHLSWFVSFLVCLICILVCFWFVYSPFCLSAILSRVFSLPLVSLPFYTCASLVFFVVCHAFSCS